MERLTERKFRGIVSSKREKSQIHCSHFCNGCSQGTGNCDYVREMVQKLADYEDKEEQGLLIELPCKVGDTVYALTPFCEICEEALDNEYACEICSKGNFVSETKFDYEMIPMFGKVIFSTEAEAEEALARMKGE